MCGYDFLEFSYRYLVFSAWQQKRIHARDVVSVCKDIAVSHGHGRGFFRSWKRGGIAAIRLGERVERTTEPIRA